MWDVRPVKQIAYTLLIQPAYWKDKSTAYSLVLNALSSLALGMVTTSTYIVPVHEGWPGRVSWVAASWLNSKTERAPSQYYTVSRRLKQHALMITEVQKIIRYADLAMNVERFSRRPRGRNDNVTKPDMSVIVGIVRYRSCSPDNEHVFQPAEFTCAYIHRTFYSIIFSEFCTNLTL